ncbi:MAG: hypothetical protein NC222_06710 [Staphylococcus sp.]|nr:hypothetical protein [Staphylococcus sp.]
MTIDKESGKIDISPDEILFGEKCKIYNDFIEKVKNHFLGTKLNSKNILWLKNLIHQTNEKSKMKDIDLEFTFLMEELC